MINRFIMSKRLYKLLYIIPLLCTVLLSSVFYTMAVNEAREKMSIEFSGLKSTVMSLSGIANMYSQEYEWTCEIKLIYIERSVMGLHQRESTDYIVTIVADYDLNVFAEINNSDWNPLDNDELIEYLFQHESGEVTVPYIGRRTIDIFFRWVPDDVNEEDRVLLLVGVLPDLLDTYMMSMLGVIVIQFAILLVTKYALVMAIIFMRHQVVELRKYIVELPGNKEWVM